MQDFIDKHDLLLGEAAIVEQLRRGSAVELDPILVHARLIYDDSGKAELERLFCLYSEIARRAGLPILLGTPTWRTNQERVQLAGAKPTINRDAAVFLCGFRDRLSNAATVKVGGLIGCKNDCYKPEEALTTDESAKFHRWQIEELATTEVDFLMAVTLPALTEAKGIALSMAETEKPYVISFVVNRDGKLLDGSTLFEAVTQIDEAVPRKPLGFMVNCAYPTFLCANDQPEALFARLIGVQSNASSLDHAELDNADSLEMEELAEWGAAMLALHAEHGMKILGGCCGTGPEHLQYLVENRPLAK